LNFFGSYGCRPLDLAGVQSVLGPPSPESRPIATEGQFQKPQGSVLGWAVGADADDASVNRVAETACVNPSSQ